MLSISWHSISERPVSTMANADRLRQAIADIRENPLSWNQRVYVDYSHDAPAMRLGDASTPCGTTFCLAGFGALRAGWAVDMSGYWYNVSDPSLEYNKRIAPIAEDWFELSGDEVQILFISTAGIRDVDRLSEVVEAVIDKNYQFALFLCDLGKGYDRSQQDDWMERSGPDAY